MKFGFTDRQHTVMTGAAITENFEMINRTDKIKSESGMTGLAHIRCRGMRPKFREHRINWPYPCGVPAVMTFRTQ